MLCCSERDEQTASRMMSDYKKIKKKKKKKKEQKSDNCHGIRLTLKWSRYIVLPLVVKGGPYGP